MAITNLKTLGSPKLIGSGTRPRNLQLLAMITLKKTGYPQKEIAELFWPHKDDPTKDLDSFKANLKKRNDDTDIIVFLESGNVSTNLECDALKLEEYIDDNQIEKALEIYSGEFFENILQTDTDDDLDVKLQRWLIETRRYYANRLLETLINNLNLYGTHEHYKKVIALTKTAIKFDLYEESHENYIQDILQRSYEALIMYENPYAAEIKDLAKDLGVVLQTSTIKPSTITNEQSVTKTRIARAWRIASVCLILLGCDFWYAERTSNTLLLSSVFSHYSKQHIAHWGLIFTWLNYIFVLGLTVMYGGYVKSKKWTEYIPDILGISEGLKSNHARIIKGFTIVVLLLAPIYLHAHLATKFLFQGNIYKSILSPDNKSFLGFEEIETVSYCNSNIVCDRFFRPYYPTVMIGHKYFIGEYNAVSKTWNNPKLTFWPFWEPWIIVLLSIWTLSILLRWLGQLYKNH